MCKLKPCMRCGSNSIHKPESEQRNTDPCTEIFCYDCGFTFGNDDAELWNNQPRADKLEARVRALEKASIDAGSQVTRV